MNNPTERDQRIAPCPFCGSEAVGVINCEEPSNEGGVAVQCEGCGASSRVHFGLKDDPVPYVINAWNERAAIQDAKQQGNEDRERLEWLCAHGTRETFDALPDYLAEAREFLDAARGVQPAAKERKYAVVHRPETCRAIQSGKSCDCAAQQESAPAAEQETSGMVQLIEGVREQRWPHTVDARVWADEWERTLRDHPNIPTDKGCMIGWFANAIMAGYDTATYRAPSPAQDKPVAASVEKIAREYAVLWVYKIHAWRGKSPAFMQRQVRDLAGHISAALAASSPSEDTKLLEFADEHCRVRSGGFPKWRIEARDVPSTLRQAIAAMSSPSEQKSSLPAETLSAQEQEVRETGEDKWLLGLAQQIQGECCTSRTFDIAHAMKLLRVWLTKVRLDAHVANCRECSGPDDGCEEGQRLEQCYIDAAHDLSPDAPRPTGTSAAPPKSKSAASAATPKENQ